MTDTVLRRRSRHRAPAPGAAALPAGAERHRFRPKLRYELLGCGLHGHRLLGTEAASLRPDDALFARPDPGGFRWHRCLRCDAWVPLAEPEAPAAEFPPERDAVALPLRGRPLRDRYVLRTIAVYRALHILVAGALVAAVFLFAAHRHALHPVYDRIVTDVHQIFGGAAVEPHRGIGGAVTALFRVPEWEVYAIGVGLASYTTILVFEMVGLWFARRWAEYLTLIEASVLLPFEVYELTHGVSWFKVASLVLNLAVVVYLLVAHRLFGVRGGAAAERAERERDTGWEPVERATPMVAGWTAAPSTAPSPTPTPGFAGGSPGSTSLGAWSPSPSRGG